MHPSRTTTTARLSPSSAFRLVKHVASLGTGFQAFLLVLFLSALQPFSLSALSSPAIADAIRPYVEKRAISGVVFLVANNEKVLDCQAVGLADIATARPMRPDTLFWIASMTKPMTAACVMMLVDEGKISLDDPVAKYIPEFAAPHKIISKKDAPVVSDEGVTTAAAKSAAPSQAAAKPALRQKPITLRHLLSHTSGMRRGDTNTSPHIDTLSLAQVTPRHARLSLLFEPGTDYSYSSIDISVLGRVIEIVSGVPYEAFLQKRLLDPLGMTDTTFWPSKPQLERLATSYRGDPAKNTLTPENIGNRSYPLDDRANRHPTPGGGLFSTAGDVARFGQFLLNKGVFNGKRLLSEAACAEMTRRQTPPGKTAYGLCLTLGEGKFGHGGMQGTNITVWPGRNLVTVFMVQRIVKWGTPDGDKLRPALEALAIQAHSPAKKDPAH